MSEEMLAEQAQKELYQLVVDIPGLTDARDKYSAELRLRDDGVGLRFAVKEECKNPDSVEKSLTKYLKTMVNADIEGVSFDVNTNQVVFQNDMAMIEAVNAYVTSNPENLDEEIVGGVSQGIREICLSMFGTAEPDPVFDARNYWYSEGFIKQTLQIACALPGYIADNMNYRVDYERSDDNDAILIKLESFENEFKMPSVIWNFRETMKELMGEDAVFIDYERDLIVFEDFETIIEALMLYLDVNPDALPENMKNELVAGMQSAYDHFPPEKIVPKKFAYENALWPRSANALANGFTAIISQFGDTQEMNAAYMENRNNGKIGYLFFVDDTIPVVDSDGDFENFPNPEAVKQIADMRILLEEFCSDLNIEIENGESEGAFELWVEKPEDFLPLMRKAYYSLEIDGVEDAYTKHTIADQALNVYGAEDGVEIVKAMSSGSAGKAFEKELGRHFNKNRMRGINAMIQENGASLMLGLLPTVPYASAHMAKDALAVGAVQRNISIEQVFASVEQERQLPRTRFLSEESHIPATAFTLH